MIRLIWKLLTLPIATIGFIMSWVTIDGEEAPSGLREEKEKDHDSEDEVERVDMTGLWGALADGTTIVLTDKITNAKKATVQIDDEVVPCEIVDAGLTEFYKKRCGR